MKISGYAAPVTLPEQVVRPARPATAVPAAPATSAGVAGSGAPAGSDPALWSVLTAEERDFFVRQSVMGPATYGPSRTQPAGLPTGQRIDVRA